MAPIKVRKTGQTGWCWWVCLNVVVFGFGGPGYMLWEGFRTWEEAIAEALKLAGKPASGVGVALSPRPPRSPGV
jgi:hypothetical protein